jgi:tRNA pseudouridine38-40 synthase
MKIALGIEYDGRRFKGWQLQRQGVRTVQSAVEFALSQVAAHPVRVTCAGRTDTGVHSTGQVVHFATERERTPRNWLLGGNANLPDDVNLIWARAVPEAFHARFSALGRGYRYVILNRESRSSLWAGRATWIHRPLDAERMHCAAQALVGTHDFSSYRALGCQAKSPVRTLRRLRVQRLDDLLVMDFYADAFLHHMVRNIAGVLIAIGKGEAPVSWAGEVLALRDRTLGGVTAPAAGLYLIEVTYPLAFGLPKPPPAAIPGPPPSW